MIYYVFIMYLLCITVLFPAKLQLVFVKSEKKKQATNRLTCQAGPWAEKSVQGGKIKKKQKKNRKIFCLTKILSSHDDQHIKGGKKRNLLLHL